MKINVLNVNGNFVKFSTSFGIGEGYCSDKNLKKGMICDIEIDLNVILKIGLNAKKNLERNLYIKNQKGVNLLNGIVESIDDDNIICFRLAIDCIIMLEYDGVGVDIGDVLLLKIRQNEFEITLTGT